MALHRDERDRGPAQGKSPAKSLPHNSRQSGSEFQNVMRAPSSIWRAAPALVAAPPALLTTPNVGEPKVVLGGAKLVWLKALKASPRNWPRTRSEIRKV